MVLGNAEFPTSEVCKTGLAVTDTTVTVGQLHSITGTMAISETGSVEAERLAIKQINDMGGVLGRKIEIIQEDGASDWPTFAEKSNNKEILAIISIYQKKYLKHEINMILLNSNNKIHYNMNKI